MKQAKIMPCCAGEAVPACLEGKELEMGEELRKCRGIGGVKLLIPVICSGVPELWNHGVNVSRKRKKRRVGAYVVIPYFSIFA
jgi:hypothetical protein